MNYIKNQINEYVKRIKDGDRFRREVEIEDGVTVVFECEEPEYECYNIHILVENSHPDHNPPEDDHCLLADCGPLMSEIDDEVGTVLDTHFRRFIEDPPHMFHYVEEWSHGELNYYTTNVYP